MKHKIVDLSIMDTMSCIFWLNHFFHKYPYSNGDSTIHFRNKSSEIGDAKGLICGH